MTAEEERAELYRQQCANRERSRLERARALSGDPAAAARVQAAFVPLLPQPDDAWDCPDPIPPGRPAWASNVPGDIELPEYLKRA